MALLLTSAENFGAISSSHVELLGKILLNTEMDGQHDYRYSETCGRQMSFER